LVTPRSSSCPDSAASTTVTNGVPPRRPGTSTRWGDARSGSSTGCRRIGLKVPPRNDAQSMAVVLLVDADVHGEGSSGQASPGPAMQPKLMEDAAVQRLAEARSDGQGGNCYLTKSLDMAGACVSDSWRLH
jgi:hypothetical protein